MGQVDSQADQLLHKLDKTDGDLDQVKKEIFGRLRSPLNYSAPAEDLIQRIQEQEASAERLREQIAYLPTIFFYIH